MYDRRFFASKLGKAAIISVAAMLAFNMLALSQQLQAAPISVAVAVQGVELA
jgi:hypothetical protein